MSKLHALYFTYILGDNMNFFLFFLITILSFNSFAYDVIECIVEDECKHKFELNYCVGTLQLRNIDDQFQLLIKQQESYPGELLNRVGTIPVRQNEQNRLIGYDNEPNSGYAFNLEIGSDGFLEGKLYLRDYEFEMMCFAKEN
jgi:hypothetical protein